MFVDLDWPLNASSLLSASAELLVIEYCLDYISLFCKFLQASSTLYKYLTLKRLRVRWTDGVHFYASNKHYKMQFAWHKMVLLLTLHGAPQGYIEKREYWQRLWRDRMVKNGTSRQKWDGWQPCLHLILGTWSLQDMSLLYITRYGLCQSGVALISQVPRSVHLCWWNIETLQA